MPGFFLAFELVEVLLIDSSLVRLEGLAVAPGVELHVQIPSVHASSMTHRLRSVNPGEVQTNPTTT
jgi:hypothetical protein